MAAFSNYLEDQIIGWAFNGATFATLPTAGTVWVSLHTADPADTGANEVTGGNYARISVAAAGWTKTTGGTASATNTAEIVYPATGTVTWSASSPGVTHVGIWNASSAGNFLFGGALTTARVVASGDVFKFLATNLTISVT
jgi:hypothetical protein